ncbi:Transmembrane protein [Quillaja saponaria]|uniref:Transmembrane protein n=1 Tax=Quillaja saponaria TaxID=32244 RepID=A0AAD7QHY8_QUISA|nr:Transmembrane protein [Quillaja saponaria]KAJ7981840.1 Transmembrane protein [Quillaja saponaria]
MTGEEVAGPAGPKVLRLLSFVGAGFICTVAINKWRELERKAILREQQREQLAESSSDVVAVHKAIK